VQFLKRNSVIALCACLVLVQSCLNQRQSYTDLTLTHEVSPQPPRVGLVTITLKPARSGIPLTGARIRLEGNMSHAGMGPVFAEAREIAPGQYQAIMELSMAGDWIVQVHLSSSDGRKLDHQFEIKGVALG